MRDVAAVLAGSAPVAALLAQAPATPTAFDGKYTGTATLTASHSVNCPNKVAMETAVNAGHGTVNGNGGVSVQNYNTNFQKTFRRYDRGHNFCE
jgi:hypothetical protein